MKDLNSVVFTEYIYHQGGDITSSHEVVPAGKTINLQIVPSSGYARKARLNLKAIYKPMNDLEEFIAQI